MVHLLDFSIASDRDPIADYETIQNELKHFSEDLYGKPQILVANKIDHPEAEAKFAEYKERLTALNPTLFVCSSVTGQGLKELVFKIYELLESAREEKK